MPVLHCAPRVREALGLVAMIGAGACSTRDIPRQTDSAGAAAVTQDSAAATLASDAAANVDARARAGADSGIVALLTVVNRGEIDAGTLARSKARSQSVRAFATDMVAEHSKAQEALRAFSSGSTRPDSAHPRGTMQPKDSNARSTRADAMQGASPIGNMTSHQDSAGMQGAQRPGQTGSTLAVTTSGIESTQTLELRRFREMSGVDFERGYMDAQVARHRKVLELLREYRSGIVDPDLQRHVDSVRMSVDAHLSRASGILVTLAGSAPTP
jgi:predicted outer membrane protein